MQRRGSALFGLLIFVQIALITANTNGLRVTHQSDATFSVFDGNEGPHFVVAVASDLLDEDDSTDATDGRIMHIKAANGTEYACRLPNLASATTSEKQLANRDEENSRNKQQQRAAEKTPEELLNALGDWCAYRVEDWWTYEVCYKKFARQYHTDAMTKKVTNEYSLGQYNEDESHMHTVAIDSTAAGGPVKYVEQTYLQGAPCDLTGDTRSTHVKYICGEALQPTLIDISEPASCHYVFTVASSRLCEHSGFIDTPTLPTKILCYPKTM